MALTRPNLPREFVLSAQRRRGVEAVAGIAHESGLSAVTTSTVCKRGRMARTTYYRIFGSAAGCLRYSFAEAHREIMLPAAGAARQPGFLGFGERLGAFYASVAAAPHLAELSLTHSHTAPEEARGYGFEDAVAEVSGWLHSARAEDRRHSLPLADEFAARTILSLAARLTRQGRSDELEGERDAVMTLVAEGEG